MSSVLYQGRHQLLEDNACILSKRQRQSEPIVTCCYDVCVNSDLHVIGLQIVRDHYSSAETGQCVDVVFHDEQIQTTNSGVQGWTLLVDKPSVSIRLLLEKFMIFAYHVNFQVNRAAVEGYTGEGDPPCIVMTLKADSTTENRVNPDLTIMLIGMEQPNTITIKREFEQQLDRHSPPPPPHPPPPPPPPPPSLPPWLLRKNEDKGIILCICYYTLASAISNIHAPRGL